jgi:hypothetical protein
MNQARQGLWSTQPKAATTPIVLPSNQVNSNMDDVPQETANICTHHVFLTVHIVIGRVSSDNTGRFLVTSNWGNAHVAVFYIYDANAIWSVPIKNRSKEELLRAVTEVHAWLTARGYRPILHKMDNQISHDIDVGTSRNPSNTPILPFQHAPHQPRGTRGPYVQEPLHGGSRQTPTIVPPSPFVPANGAKQCHAQHDAPVLP